MMQCLRRPVKPRVLLGLLFGLLLAVPVRSATAESPAEPQMDFAHEVVPILRKHCVACHGGQESKGGFSLNTRELLLDSEAVVPGQAGESWLIELVSSEDPEMQMPPKERPRVSAEEIAVLRRWIDQQLPWEEGFTFAEPTYEPPLAPRRPELPPVVDGRTNPIDRLLDQYLAEQGLARPQPLEDAAFLRKLYLDVLGLLPTPEELDAFLNDPSSNKRSEWIQKVLADDRAYAEHWLTFWNDLLRNDYVGTGYIDGGRKQITDWLYSSLLENKSYDQFVRELIAPTPESEGFVMGIKWRGTVNASQTREVQFAQNISQVFLGINMKCASCHDSFIDRWTLEEAYGLAAIYSTEPLEIYRCDKPTGQTATAGWIFPELGQIDGQAAQSERLRQLADLMTHPENGRFTRTIVNRLWHRLMGRGIVHPVDAMHTRPWNADLLDYLAVYLVDQQYDLKKVIELIVSSAAYQSYPDLLEEEPSVEGYVYRGPVAKRMTAEQFVDAVWQITGAGPTKPDAPIPGLGADHLAVARQGQWIWAYAEGSEAVPKPGEQFTFEYTFELESLPRSAAAVITCDNEYVFRLNGQQLAEDNDWTTVEYIRLDRALQIGRNVLQIVGRNAGDAPNPAALFFEAKLVELDGSVRTLGSNSEWLYARELPAADGKLPAEADRQPAAVVARQDFLGPGVEGQIRANLALAQEGELPMVRAALMKSDLLMRSLGRPNREQVVTTRPTELTTLQAIDLANGPILAETLQRGARHILAQRNWSTDELIEWLFLHALSRRPTAEEREVAWQLVGPTPSPQGVEDLLWAVLMLPEFQIIR